jgi:hypothetical protein
MDVPDEYLREIGLVVVYFNSLEFLLHSALVLELLGKPDSDGRANAIFAEMGFDQKLIAFESMLRISDKTPRSAKHPFKAVRTLLGEAKDKRNIVAHHMWTGNNGIVHKSDVQLRKGALKLVLDKVSLEELAEMAQFISEARTALQKFCMERYFPASDVPQQGQ